MQGNTLVVLIGIIVWGCVETDVSATLYDYQVERLLSGQLGNKTWDQVITSENCKDSVKLYIEQVSFSTDDSLDIFQLTSSSSCRTYDTSYLGRADASSYTGGIAFTDSLIFSSGDFWLINTLTSESFDTTIGNDKISFRWD